MTLQEFCSKQDHSALGWVVTKETVKKYCDEVLKYGFASICTNPDNIAYAASLLKGRAGIACVVGFPQGIATTETKIAEGLRAIDDGATDLDFVINHSRLHEGDDAYVQNELNAFVKAMKAKKPDVVVKIIMYAPYDPVQPVSAEETVRAANMIVASGADYIKFCKDFALIRSVVKGRIKMKHSGCATFDDCVNAIELGCDRIGHELAPQFIEENSTYFAER